LSALALAVVALLAVAACGGGGQGGTTSFKGVKKIGLSAALTGQSQLYGLAKSNALKLAADDLNAKGGVNGYQIQPDIQDDGTTVDKAVANVKQLLLQDQVAALIGPVTSAQCQATSPISRENKVLLIAATCSSYQLTTEPDLINPNFISIVPNTYMEGTAAGQLVAKTGATHIFVVSPKYLFGISETNAFVAALKKANPSAQIVNPESTWYVPFPTNPRWDSTINAIQAAKPDLVYSNIFAGDEINFVKQAQGVDPQWFQKYPMTTLASVDELQALTSSYPLGMHLYMRAPFFALNNPQMADFVQRYRARFNTYPSDWAVMDYDAIMMWAKAATAAGGFDTDAVRSQIVGHTFQSLRGYSYVIRPEDQQANVGETVGVTASSGSKFPFPVLDNSTNLTGNNLIMPTKLVSELKAGQCEKGGDPKTSDFANCPSWQAG
jgi:branched-chain amino acid transport system substrate-binding protein